MEVFTLKAGYIECKNRSGVAEVVELNVIVSQEALDEGGKDGDSAEHFLILEVNLGHDDEGGVLQFCGLRQQLMKDLNEVVLIIVEVPNESRWWVT